MGHLSDDQIQNLQAGDVVWVVVLVGRLRTALHKVTIKKERYEYRGSYFGPYGEDAEGQEYSLQFALSNASIVNYKIFFDAVTSKEYRTSMVYADQRQQRTVNDLNFKIEALEKTVTRLQDEIKTRDEIVAKLTKIFGRFINDYPG